MSKTRAPRAGAVGTAARWPAGMVQLAARALPKGAVRDRYRAEFLADLYGLTRRQQTRYARCGKDDSRNSGSLDRAGFGAGIGGL